jgi:hypothetical protein
MFQNRRSKNLSNNDSLANLERRLSLHSSSQVDELDSRIKAIKRLHASKGLLKSSATINEVAGACIVFFESKRDFFREAVLGLTFEFENGLGEKLMSAFTAYCPGDFDKVDQRLIEVIQMTGGEQHTAKYMGRMHEQRDRISENIKNEIDQLIINLKARVQISTLERALILFEVVCLLVVAYLAGRWSVDSTGNYEPFIVALGAVSAALEIGRRFWKKGTT